MHRVQSGSCPQGRSRQDTLQLQGPLQSGAHLIALERTRIGDITLDKCMSPDDIDVFLDENITTEKDCED